MDQIPYISDRFMEFNTNFPELIQKLREGFGQKLVHTPMRHHHDYPNPDAGIDSTLLLMPAWEKGKDLGVKIVSVNPNNGQYNLPSIQGSYLYLDAHKGIIRAIFDAKCLTAKRTAATSALASSLLARKNTTTMLMLGTGALASNLIKAHASVLPIKEVFIWGRDYKKAQLICDQMESEEFDIIPVRNYQEKITEVDLISCATLSKEPLVLGKLLKNGQHLDLVGAYKTDMREADDDAILRSSVFLDTFQGGLKESGDIVIPMNSRILKKSDIKADLFELCSMSKKGRQSDKEISFFKSVGHASEDLIGARYFYQQFLDQKS